MAGEIPRVYDCFTFFNELDLLELRFAEMDRIVDRFVLVEATTTFMGQPKPLYFAENRDRFRAFRDRIVHIVVDDLPTDAQSPWVRESLQRDAIARGLTDVRAQDRIIVSDVDEIIKPEKLRIALTAPWLEHRLIGFWCTNYSHRLNLRYDHPHTLGPRLICYRNIKSPQFLREFSLRVSKRPWTRPIAPAQSSLRATRKFGIPLWATIVWNGAWHFTSMGSYDQWRSKFTSWSHAPELPAGLSARTHTTNQWRAYRLSPLVICPWPSSATRDAMRICSHETRTTRFCTRCLGLAISDCRTNCVSNKLKRYVL